MSVLVTGGAGYIGSVAVERLIASGESVVVLDNLSTGYREAVAREAVFVEGDIRDIGVLRRVLSEHTIDTVMHFAAFSIVPVSCTDPLTYFENNVVGAHTVLKAMIEAKVPRFILSSTAAVYGDPESVPITEDMPTRPLNPYGLSKRMIEQMLEWYHTAYGLGYVALRYFNAAGASEAHGEAHDPESHLIPIVLMAALGLRDGVTVFGTGYDTPDGTCVRDYIHVEDLADAHLKAMAYLRNGHGAGIFNLGNCIGNSVREVIETVKRVTGHDFPIHYGEPRTGDADKLVASSESAQRQLGWQPRKGDIETIVRDAWTWRQAHPRGYKG
ncbi:MAG: UDP-glucose 4-epimerase [Candidatus Hydrogenedentes bacterium]|nr:UDP-glucose 4-epimerase [Candidatus Hydrogenedentota bacterium]